MKATGWCENCGDVQVDVRCMWSGRDRYLITNVDHDVAGSCCHYADCPRCGGDVDQWATS